METPKKEIKMKKFNITALGPDGEIVLYAETKTNHPVSEILNHVEQCAKDLWYGFVINIAISEVKE